MTRGQDRRLLIAVNIPRFFLSHRLDLALEARRRGYEVHVLSSSADAEGLERIASQGLRTHGIPLAQHGTSPLGELRAITAMLRAIRRIRPDVLHLVTIKPVLYGGVASRILRVPRTVAALTGLGRMFASDREPPRWLVMALRAALGDRRTTLVVQNRDDQLRVGRLRLTRSGNAELIRGSGVDPGRFTVREEPAVPRVLYAGRLMRSKGLEAFIDVGRRLAGRAEFAVAGYEESGSPDAIGAERLQGLHDEGAIVWLGHREDMPRVIAESTMVVLPTVYPEGVPRILIEASSCGRPTVATDVPGCREICIDDVTGLLVPPGDPDALEAAVLRLLGDPELRRRLGAAGRALVEEGFSLHAVIERTLALYEGIPVPDIDMESADRSSSGAGG